MVYGAAFSWLRGWCRPLISDNGVRARRCTRRQGPRWRIGGSNGGRGEGGGVGGTIEKLCGGITGSRHCPVTPGRRTTLDYISFEYKRMRKEMFTNKAACHPSRFSVRKM